MNGLFATATHSIFGLFAASGPWLGKAAFVGVFVLVLVWLVLMPGRLIGQADGAPPWWRNTRVWAILIALIEIAVYLRWG